MKHNLKRVLSLVLCIAMVLSLCAFGAGAETTTVATIGTTNYTTLADAIAAAKSGDTVTLTANIDLSSTNWVPMVLAEGFTLTIDGNHHAINNLKTTTGCETPREGSAQGDGSSCFYCSGFVGSNKGTLTVKNLTFANPSIAIVTAGVEKAGASSLAVVVGRNTGTLTLDNVCVSGGSVTAYTKGGALVGQTNGTVTISNCTVEHFKVNVVGCTDDPQAAGNGAILGWVNPAASLTVTNLAASDNTCENGSSGWDSTRTDGNGTIWGTTGGKDYIIWSPLWNVNYAVPAVSFVASVGERNYISLPDAITAAASGNTVKLLSDVTLTATQTIDKSLTLDLNGHKVTGDDCRAFVVTNGTLNLTGTGTISSTYKTALADTSSVIRVSGDTDDAALVVGANVTISTDWCYGVSVFGKFHNQTLTVNGKISVTGDASAIAGTGAAGYLKPTIVINDGAVVSATGSVAIYHPQGGTLTVNGGTVTGGIEAKGGTVNVKGGTITAYGQVLHKTNGDGPSTNGYAIALVENAGYDIGNSVSLNVTGGSISGQVAKLVDSAHNGTVTLAISGGMFKTAPDTAYLKTGYLVQSSGDNDYPYMVAAGTNTVKEEVTQAVDAANNKDATSEQVAAAVEAVQNADNASLTDTGTLGALAALEDKVLLTNTKITVSDPTVIGVTDVTSASVDNAALSVSDPATTTETTVAVAITAGTTSAADAKATAEAAGATVPADAKIIPLDITMKIDDTPTQPKAPLAIKLAVKMTLEEARKVLIVHFKSAGVTETIIPSVTQEDKTVYLSFAATSLSDFVLVQTNQTQNDNAYVLYLKADKTNVSTGQDITYSVSLKRVSGTDSIGFIQLSLSPKTDGQLTYKSSARASGFNFTISDNTVKIYFSDAVNPITLAADAEVKLGTITYTAASALTDGAKLDGFKADGTDGVSASANSDVAALTITTDDVVYRCLTVTFTNNGRLLGTAYAKYGESTLYKNTYFATVFAIPAPTNDDTVVGTSRLLNTNWYQSGSDTAYSALTVYTADMSYVTKTTPEYAVTVTAPSEITPTVKYTSGARTADNTDYYAAASDDLVFTVSDTGIYTPTVSYSINGATPVVLSASNGSSYTIHKTSITGLVNIKISVSVTVESLKTFKTDTGDAWQPYSMAYASDKTLVLMKLGVPATGGYTLTGTTIFKLEHGDYGDYNYIMLLPKAAVSTVSDSEMTAYLTANLKVDTGAADKTLVYNYNTNGRNGAYVADVQAAYDFMSLTQSQLKWTPTDELLLLADVVTYNGNNFTDLSKPRDGKITADDINAFLYDYAGFPVPAD